VSGYLPLFSIPLFGLRKEGIRLPVWVKAASLSGLLVTLLFVALSIFPIIEVQSWLAYSLKIGGVIIGADLVGAAIFLNAERKRAAHLTTSM
jgi:hypothetical protein